MTTAVVYVRISKDPEGRQVQTERQEKDCRALAASLNLKVDRVFADNDIGASALSGKRRPAYEEMMSLAESGQIGVILAYSNSRLTRRPLELERLIVAHDRTGVEFRTVVSGRDDLSTADGRMVARIKASVDAAESERISERTKRAKDAAREQGLWLGGWRPYGFEADGRTVRVAEATVIADACQALLAGVSVTAIVRGLNNRGVPTSTGGTWSTRGLVRVLTRAKLPIDEGTAEAVRLLLADPTRRTTPGPERRWLMSGLALCDICQDTLRGSGSSLGSGRGTYPAYRCRTGKHVVVNAVVLDEFISAIVVERLSRPDAADLFAPTTVDTSGLRTERATLRARLDALADDLDVDERTLSRRAGALQARIDEIDQRITAAARTSPLSPFIGRDPGEVWAGLDLMRRRAVVEVLMTVTIRRTGRGVVPVEHRWREDLSTFDPRRVVVAWRS